MGKTQDNGLIGHTMILSRLVKLGYEVLLPWADCDAVFSLITP